jgi:CRP/FNR family cyclic AMP-dependent transcriptional regulator
MCPQNHGDVGFVLDLDPDLGRGVCRADWDQARQACRGRLVSLPVGRNDLGLLVEDPGQLAGLLLIAGAVCREIKLRDRHLVELLGPGDVVRPSGNDPDAPVTVGPTTTALSDVRLMALGTTFIQAAARWPSLLIEVLDRMERQRAQLAVQELIVHLPRAEHRVLLMLAHLSSRWGHVTPDGIHLPLRLTHDLLGQLTAARRPTVTLAVGELEANGCLTRAEDGTWTLTAAGQQAVDSIAQTDRAGTLGDILLMRQQSGSFIRDSRALHADAGQIRARDRSGGD